MLKDGLKLYILETCCYENYYQSTDIDRIFTNERIAYSPIFFVEIIKVIHKTANAGTPGIFSLQLLSFCQID